MSKQLLQSVDEGLDDDGPQIPPPVPALSLLGLFSPLLLAPIGFLVLLALFGPDNALDRWSTARAFTHWMQAELPFIHRHAASTAYPQLALLVDCLTVAMVPLFAAVLCGQSMINYPRLLARHRALRPFGLGKHLLVLTLFPILALLAVYAMVGIAGDPSWASGFTTRHRGGLALINPVSLYVAGLAIGGWPALLRLLFDVHLRKE